MTIFCTWSNNRLFYLKKKNYMIRIFNLSLPFSASVSSKTWAHKTEILQLISSNLHEGILSGEYSVANFYFNFFLFLVFAWIITFLYFASLFFYCFILYLLSLQFCIVFNIPYVSFFIIFSFLKSLLSKP